MTRFDDLTIATTVHNNAAMGADMLRSFEAHIGEVKEIVVVDDHSDLPLTGPPSFSPVRIIRTEKPLGFCKAADLALRACKRRTLSWSMLTFYFSRVILPAVFRSFAKDPGPG